MHGYIPTRTIPPPVAGFPVSKLVGSLTATGTTPWVPLWLVPNACYAQIEGTSGAVTATCHFEFSDDGSTLACKGSAISLSGTSAGAGVAVVMGITRWLNGRKKSGT